MKTPKNKTWELVALTVELCKHKEDLILVSFFKLVQKAEDGTLQFIVLGYYKPWETLQKKN